MVLGEVKAVDERRFQIILKRPFRTMLFSLGSRNIFVQPERIASTPVSEQFKEVIGSGPYRFIADEFQAGATSHYARWEKYVPRNEPPDMWSGGHVANFDRVEWTAQPDPSIGAAALQRGEVDWLEQPLLDLIPMLSKTPGVKTEAVDPFGGLAILRFNHLLPPFRNPEMRRALLPGIDQSLVVSAVVGDQPQYGRVPVGFFTAGSPMANDAGIEALTGTRSLDEARRRIIAAGYKGERLVMVAPTDIPAIMTMSQVMQDQLTKMGLNIDFQATDWGTMIARLAKRDPIDQGGWNLYCVTWAGLTVSNPGSSYPLRGNGLSAVTGWPTDEKLEVLRLKWLDTSDLAEQQAIARQIQEEAFVSLPFIPLGQWSISGSLQPEADRHHSFTVQPVLERQAGLEADASIPQSPTVARRIAPRRYLCLPIMPSERTDDEDRRAMRSMRYARLSAQVDEGEYPCPMQDACALRHRSYILPTDGAGDFRRTPRHGRGTALSDPRP